MADGTLGAMAVRKPHAKPKKIRRASDDAARRLRRAGFRVEEPTTDEPFKPISVRGLDLSGALRKSRGK
jgi:hypothetical protein